MGALLWLGAALLLWAGPLLGQSQETPPPAPAFSPVSPSAEPGAREFRFERLDRTYEAFITELAPVEIGPALVKLSSPEHSLTLVRHVARLEPLGRGEFLIDLEVRFAGVGALEADVTFGRIESHLSDQLAVPVQTLRLAGRVHMAAGAEGYLITVREIPAEVTVHIESALAQRLFGICHQMVLVLVNLDCVELEQSLTRVRVPLPGAGETYLLTYEELTEDERLTLDGFLLESLLADG